MKKSYLIIAFIFIISSIGIRWLGTPKLNQTISEIRLLQPLTTKIPFKRKNLYGYSLAEVANYNGRVILLNKLRYWYDRTAKIAPFAVVVGWGKLSDNTIIDTLSITQRSRTYSWEIKGNKLTNSEVANYSENLHLIAPNSKVNRLITNAPLGAILNISGSVVKATSLDSWYFAKKFSGKSKLLWVTDLIIESR
jgi:hypothetical protein